MFAQIEFIFYFIYFIFILIYLFIFWGRGGEAATENLFQSFFFSFF